MPFTYLSDFLSSSDVAMLSRVYETTRRPADTVVDRETRAMAILHLFQSGIAKEKDLIRVIASNAYGEVYDLPATGRKNWA
ncbi:hypothetical protein G6N74_30105 [Mesorhizobium sp. CGMCC 1.15528]|uniref:Uncharacterized protein n=1 Tax=Mesorhizobium zhangyense TaxID=1776730 RepID=A0A7C9VEA7_9HYPH|nr:hypothetical protein [Mesorhizobium zhangyense]NGN45306.1 hypothetical protein [Mesorhizobium zhangyense]